MSAYDILPDAPGLLRAESLNTNIKLDRTSETTARVSWNIPTPAAGKRRYRAQSQPRLRPGGACPGAAVGRGVLLQDDGTRDEAGRDDDRRADDRGRQPRT